MRFLLGISIFAIAACSGAASTELFSGEPTNVVEPAPTEPGDSTSAAAPSSPPKKSTPDAAADVSAPPPSKDAGVADAKKDAEPTATACTFDTDCTVDDQICNWKTDTCAAPGPLGAPCKRDLECTDGLCNWKLAECSDPASAGTPCRRNKECASGSCGANSICK